MKPIKLIRGTKFWNIDPSSCHPGFSGLSLVDQMALLQSGWMETLVLNVVWRSLGLTDELQFTENMRLNESQCSAAGLHDLYTALRHLASKYQQMGLNQEEMVTLKAMSLANSGVFTYTF